MSDGRGRAWPSSSKGIFKRPDSAPNHYNTDLTQKAEGGSASTKRKKSWGNPLTRASFSSYSSQGEKEGRNNLHNSPRSNSYLEQPCPKRASRATRSGVRLRLNYRPNAFYIANSIVIDRPLWWLLPLEFLGELRETVGG